VTYLQFLLIFIVPWLIVETIIFLKNYSKSKKLFFSGLFFLSLLALTYSTPWDNYLVKIGVWDYPAGRVLGVIGYVPIEEYCFFILQTALTGYFVFFLTRKMKVINNFKRSILTRVLGSIFFLCITLFGIYALQSDPTKYLGLILSWAAPVMLIQWAFGGDYLFKNFLIYITGIAIPTIYLWIADAVAIRLNIWSISEKFTTGYKLFNLPIEEAIFFLSTNIMVVQGLLLFWWYFENKKKLSN
jgi:lycopene beta-cyclase